MRDIEHREAFEGHGETYVRLLAEKNDQNIAPHARAWLSEQQSLRDEEAASKRDAREERTLAIAEEALFNSKRANRIAISAIICAATATIIATVIGVMFSK